MTASRIDASVLAGVSTIVAIVFSLSFEIFLESDSVSQSYADRLPLERTRNGHNAGSVSFSRPKQPFNCWTVAFEGSMFGFLFTVQAPSRAESEIDGVSLAFA